MLTMSRTGRTRCSTTTSYNSNAKATAAAVVVTVTVTVVASAGAETDAMRGLEQNSTRRALYWERQVYYLLVIPGLSHAHVAHHIRF